MTGVSHTYNLTTGCSQATGYKYNWTIYSYIEAPFALLIGGLNAIGKGSQSSWCSQYTNSAKAKLVEAKQGF
jgi:hypothetical protein